MTEGEKKEDEKKERRKKRGVNKNREREERRRRRRGGEKQEEHQEKAEGGTKEGRWGEGSRRFQGEEEGAARMTRTAREMMIRPGHGRVGDAALSADPSPPPVQLAGTEHEPFDLG